MTQEPTPDAGLGEVKLSCRNVWKIYGPDPAGFFPGGRGAVDDVGGHIARIRESGHIAAACDVSFDVHLGEIFVIMGLSGSGKSTVVRCLSRLVEPTAGEVVLDGENLLEASQRELIEMRRHKMGMVFQNFGLLPHQTALENVAFPLKVQGVGRTEREAKAHEMIELVGLEGRENAFPHELSGGMQQRVGLARALASDPVILLMDEPFSALDPLIRRQLQGEFLELTERLHKTTLFITHDLDEAIRLGNRIAIMKDGRLSQIGTPEEIITNPADEYVADFVQGISRLKLIYARTIMRPIDEHQADGPADPLDGCPTVPPDATLNELIDCAIETDKPIVVEDEPGHALGVITKRTLLRSIQGEQ